MPHANFSWARQVTGHPSLSLRRGGRSLAEPTGFPMVQPSDHRASTASAPTPGWHEEAPAEGAPLKCLHPEATRAIQSPQGRPVQNLVGYTRWARHISLPRLLLCDPGQGTALSAPHLGKGR